MPADKTFRLRGATSAAAHPPVSEVAITSASSVTQGAARGAAVGELEMPADAVVRVVLANGFVLWSRADDLLRARGVHRADQIDVGRNAERLAGVGHPHLQPAILQQ